jgi:hypothetical protein
MAAPPPGYPVVNQQAAGPSSGYAPQPTMAVQAVDARAAPDDKASQAIAAGVPVQQQQQHQQVYPPQQPQAYVDPNTGQTVYYAPNGQPYYAQQQQVYPPPPANPYAPGAQGQYMAAYPQQQQQQYYAQQQQGGAGGAGAGLCAGLLGGLLACCCLDMIF